MTVLKTGLRSHLTGKRGQFPRGKPGEAARVRGVDISLAGGWIEVASIVHPPGEVVVGMRPVSVFAKGPGSEIEQLRAQLQGRWRQAARAVMVLLSLHGLPPSQIAEPAPRPGVMPASAERRREHLNATRAVPRPAIDRALARRDVPLREKTLWARIASRAARSRVPAG